MSAPWSMSLSGPRGGRLGTAWGVTVILFVIAAE
jgi:hypothetical protein